MLNVESITPHLRRLLLGGGDLQTWLSNVDVCRSATWVSLSVAGDAESTYALRHVNPERTTITIDFAIRVGDITREIDPRWSEVQAGDEVLILARGAAALLSLTIFPGYGLALILPLCRRL